MYKSILVPIDLSEESSWRKSLPSAIAMARTFGTDLHVITVVPDFGRSIVGGYFPEGFEAQALQKTSEMLKEFLGQNVPGDITCKGHVAHGVIYEEVNKAADKPRLRSDRFGVAPAGTEGLSSGAECRPRGAPCPANGNGCPRITRV